MTAFWRHSLPWLLLAASSVVGAQSSDPYRLLVPEHDYPETGIGPLNQLGRGLQPRLGPARPVDSRFSVLPSVEAGPGLSLLCDSSFGLGVALADLERHCLLGRLDDQGWVLGSVQQLSLTQEFSFDAGLPLDFEFGLSWLRGEPADPMQELPGLDLLDPRFAPVSGLAGDLSGESLHFGATHWLNERSWLRVTGRGTRLRSETLFSPGALTWSSRSLSLDAGLGSFAGVVTGRQTDIPELRRSWFDLDVGVSWRTPWSARLTVGARNLLSPADAVNSETPLGNDRLMESRTPYVRYQQDL